MHDYKRHKAALIISANFSGDVVQKSLLNRQSLLSHGSDARPRPGHA